MLTQDRLKELLHYDPETGIFTWIVSKSNRAPAGSVAGGVSKNRGYVVININCTHFLAHRLAWLYAHGKFPPEQLDHINRVRTDNRLCNLRLATNAENCQNKKMQSNNNSGYFGVSWNKSAKKWHAQIAINYKRIHIGYFTEPSEAIAARKAAEIKYHTFQHP